MQAMNHPAKALGCRFERLKREVLLALQPANTPHVEDICKGATQELTCEKPQGPDHNNSLPDMSRTGAKSWHRMLSA